MQTRRIIDEAIIFKNNSKDFYKVSADKSNNLLLKKFFEYLAADEANQVRKIEEHYGFYLDTGRWGLLKFGKLEAPGDAIKTLIEEFKYNLSDFTKFSSLELEIIETAKDLEMKSYKLYKDKSIKSDKEDEKFLFDFLANEELNHFLIIKTFKFYINRFKENLLLKEDYKEFEEILT